MLAVLAILLLAGTATAGKYDIEFVPTVADDTFSDFIREAGMVTAYRGIGPAEPNGLTGFDVGVELSLVDIDASRWDLALKEEDFPDCLSVPKIHVRKGLPFNLDVGAMYSEVPDSNIKLWGGEVQWALLEGTAATPALAVRGSYSTLEGVDDLDLYTYAGDVVASKGFAIFTPYVGIGAVRISGEYAGDNEILQATLKDHDFTETRYFAGLQASFAVLRVTIDAEYMRRPIYTLKLSLGW